MPRNLVSTCRLHNNLCLQSLNQIRHSRLLHIRSLHFDVNSRLSAVDNQSSAASYGVYQHVMVMLWRWGWRGHGEDVAPTEVFSDKI